MADNHHLGPSMALWTTLFYRVVPDSGADSVAVIDCNIIFYEVDYNTETGDTVWTAVPDTGIDTIAVTGVAAELAWQKKAFSVNPANGLGFVVETQAGHSDAMSSAVEIWYHLRKKIGVFQ